MEIPELDQYINTKIQGVFSQSDMAVLREEIEKLYPGEVYVEIGVNEGKSARVAKEYAKEGVRKIWIDIKDVNPVPGITIGRGDFMEQEGMVGIGKDGFYVHGDADLFADLIYVAQRLPEQYIPFINLIFIDGHHDYESVRENTLKWEPLVQKGGVMLFHDYDHPDTKKWLDEHYGDRKEVFHNKMVKVIKDEKIKDGTPPWNWKDAQL